MGKQPKIICLCGSTRFKREFALIAEKITLDGDIFLTVGVYQDRRLDGTPVTEEAKAELGKLHLKKIDLADEIGVIAVNAYVGASTLKEIEYAQSVGKRVAYYLFGSQITYIGKRHAVLP